MAIVSSNIILNSPQGINGNYIIEEFTDNVGKKYRVEGLRASGGDFQQAMVDRIPTVESILSETVIQKEEAIKYDIIDQKIADYLATIDLKKDVNLTDEELALYEKRKK